VCCAQALEADRLRACAEVEAHRRAVAAHEQAMAARETALAEAKLALERDRSELAAAQASVAAHRSALEQRHRYSTPPSPPPLLPACAVA
jgi:hypothetical protein